MATILGVRVRSVDVDDSLVLHDDPILHVERGGRCIAEESEAELAWCARRALDIKAAFPPGASVAILGGGTFILPRLLSDYRLTVYELEQALVDDMLGRFGLSVSTVVGDYRKTLRGKFDAIVYHIEPKEAEPLDLTPYLGPGGRVFP